MLKNIPVVALLLMLFTTTVMAQNSTTADKDLDGIPDAWETAGYVNITMPDGSKQKLDLTRDGPLSPDHQDIFVWIAWMEDSSHTHRPSPKAMQYIKDAFAAAPRERFNPDGKKGIRLHIYYSANPLPEKTVLGSVDAMDNYDWSDFRMLMNSTFPKDLMGKFHFCIFAHNIPQGRTGIADISGYNLIVSLGDVGPNGVGVTEDQAGTFMHELGHNLGLLHGGIENTPLYKPNYISVMNYLFQLGGIQKNGAPSWDYSEFSLEADERALLKEKGLNASPDLAIYGTQYYCGTKMDWQSVDSITDPIDWDCSGSMTGSAHEDINHDGEVGILHGANDWENVRLIFTSNNPAAGVVPKQRLKISDELDAKMANTLSLPRITHIQASLGPGGVRLWWPRIDLDRMIAYTVRRQNSNAALTEIGATKDNTFLDRNVPRGSNSYYVSGVFLPYGSSRTSPALSYIIDPASPAFEKMDGIGVLGTKRVQRTSAASQTLVRETTISFPVTIEIR